jgi:hypothetical protein
VKHKSQARLWVWKAAHLRGFWLARVCLLKFVPSDRIHASKEGEELRSDTFAVGPTYRKLMADWFSAPNILTDDGITHFEHKGRWKEQLSTLPSDAETVARNKARAFIKSALTPRTKLDL